MRQDIRREDAALIVGAGQTALDGWSLFLPSMAIAGRSVPNITEIPGHGGQRVGGALVTHRRAAMSAAGIPDIVESVDLQDATGIAADNPALITEALNRHVAETREPGISFVRTLKTSHGGALHGKSSHSH